MKLSFILCVVILTGFSVAGQNSVLIKGSVEDATIRKIYLTLIDSSLKFIDSCEVIDKQFVFRTHMEKPDIYELYYNNGYNRIPIALEAGSDIAVAVGEEVETKVNNGKEEEVMRFFKSELKPYSASYSNAPSDGEIDFKSIIDQGNKRLMLAIEKYPRTLGAIYTLSAMLGLDDSDFFRMYESVIDTTSYRHSHYFKKVQADYHARKSVILVGSEAPDFESKTFDGKPFNLSSLRGKYVLLNFWASWCAPCRKKNKEIAEYLNQSGKKDFILVSFNVDDEKKAWKNASEKDQITWINVSNGKGFYKNRIVENYKIKHLPSIFLINPGGVVVKQNLPFEEMIKHD